MCFFYHHNNLMMHALHLLSIKLFMLYDKDVSLETTKQNMNLLDILVQNKLQVFVVDVGILKHVKRMLSHRLIKHSNARHISRVCYEWFAS